MSEEKLLPWLLILPILHITSPNMGEIGTGTLTSPPVSTQLVHYTRITGSLTVSALFDPNLSGDPNSNLDAQRIKRACEVVRQATVWRKDPNYHGGDPNNSSATLTVWYIPYHHILGPVHYPNTYPGPGPIYTECACDSDPNTSDCTVDDPRQMCHDEAELALYVARINFVKARVDEFNTAQSGQPGTPVVIGQQFFNAERWATTGIPSWDLALSVKHNLLFNRARGPVIAGQQPLLPDVPIYQYDRGGVYLIDKQSDGDYNPWNGPYYALDEKGDAYGVSLYQVWDLDRSRERMRRTALRAVAKKSSDPNATGTGQLVPWIGLGCGFPELGYGEAYEPDMDYGLGAARDMGALLRALRAADPNNPFGVDPNYPVAINQAALYPEPFSVETPRYAQYFVEYVRGFTD